VVILFKETNNPISNTQKNGNPYQAFQKKEAKTYKPDPLQP
jgi:hypothetical protein